jgi:hypothetical protein
MTLHTRNTLVAFGATAMIPAVQAVSFFVEIGPLVLPISIANLQLGILGLLDDQLDSSLAAKVCPDPLEEDAKP